MKLKNELKIVYSIIKSKLLNKKIPIFVSWSVTSKCNRDCKYCYITKQDKELKTEYIFLMIDELASLGCRYIHFTGGEPLIRKDIGALVDYAKNKGLVVNINTNGAFFPCRFQEIKNVDSLTFSIDGPEKVHDSVRGKGSFKEVIRAIDIAKKEHFDFSFITTLTKNNIESINFVLNLAKKFDTKVGFQPAIETLNSKPKKELIELLCPQEQYKRAINYLIDEKRNNPNLISNSLSALKHIYYWPNSQKNNCCAGKIYFKISPDGKIYACKANKKTYISDNIQETIKNIKQEACTNCWSLNKIELGFIHTFNLSYYLGLLKNRIPVLKP